jgi:uncharacterized protein YxjI
MNDSLYFRDNFFSAGTTEIFNSSKEKVGELDLKSSFSSSIDVIDKSGRIIVSGKFPFMSNKWLISDSNENELGKLKAKFSFLSKRYEYTTNSRGVYEIESEPFSYEYKIYDDQLSLAARFEKVSGFFSSPAYRLNNLTERLTTEELIAVVMGVNAIQKRKRNAANSN